MRFNMKQVKIIAGLIIISVAFILIVNSCKTHKMSGKGGSVKKAAPIKDVDITIKKITPKSSGKK